MVNNRDIDNLINEIDDILGPDYEEKKQQHLQQLRMVYDNLSDGQDKKDLAKVISYYKQWEEGGVSTDEFIRLNDRLTNKWLIKDNSWKELWEELNGKTKDAVVRNLNK